MDGQAIAQNIGYERAQGLGAAIGNQMKPRELGYIDRTQGLCVGLSTLADQLAAFAGRINGIGLAGNSAKQEAPTPTGFAASLSDAEVQLRRCFEIMKNISDDF
jgi:hypothetical protein